MTIAGYLEKLYDKLNADFFGGVLERPVITIQSSSRSYGHYTLASVWDIKGEGYKEINIAAGTLNRPIEATVCTLLHEMCHQYNNEILNVQDCSRSGMYHNRLFAKTASEHGLTVSRSEKYEYSITSPSDRLLEWILDNDIQEIKLTRNDLYSVRIAGGNAAAEGGALTSAARPNHNHRYVCPCCHNIARSGKPIRLICGDCMKPMMEG